MTGSAVLPPTWLRRLLHKGSTISCRRHRATLTLDSCSAIKPYESIPSPKGYPIFGTLPAFIAAGGVERHHLYASRRHEQLGGIYREALGPREMVFVSDPNIVRQVFAAEGQYPRHFIPEAWTLYNTDRKAQRGIFFMDGSEWRLNRTILNRHLLRPGSVKPHLPQLAQVAQQLVQRWTTRYQGQLVPDLERELYHWSIQSLGAVTFGIQSAVLDATRDADQSDKLLDDFCDAIHAIFQTTCAMGTVPPTLARRLRLKLWTRFAHSLDQALHQGEALVNRGLNEARAGHEGGSDDGSEGGSEGGLLLEGLVQEGLDTATITRLLVDLFIAAADTTTHTAIWTLYLLAKHPEVMAKVRQEVMAASGGTGKVEGHLTALLPYLRGVVKEALRMYPVAPFQTRALARDTDLGGYMVPQGTMVVLSVYTTGRDANYFPDPDVFRPERWHREAPPLCPGDNTPSHAPRAKLHSHAFIPFGVGARSCVGRRVSEAQLHLLLATLAARCNITAVNDVSFVMRMVGVTSEPLQLRVDAV